MTVDAIMALLEKAINANRYVRKHVRMVSVQNRTYVHAIRDLQWIKQTSLSVNRFALTFASIPHAYRLLNVNVYQGMSQLKKITFASPNVRRAFTGSAKHRTFVNATQATL